MSDNDKLALAGTQAIDDAGTRTGIMTEIENAYHKAGIGNQFESARDDWQRDVAMIDLSVPPTVIGRGLTEAQAYAQQMLPDILSEVVHPDPERNVKLAGPDEGIPALPAHDDGLPALPEPGGRAAASGLVIAGESGGRQISDR